jgi:hypothetical protein
MNITDPQNYKQSVTLCTFIESLMTINQSIEKKVLFVKSYYKTENYV